LRSWACGLSTTAPKPLVVVIGGIVTIKEQWAPMLTNLKRLGMAAIVTELPGAGENTLTYGPDSSRMLSALLDAVADRADVAHTYPIAMSFSGHLALRCATTDPRIRGIVTVGAPTSRFFTDADWQRALPRVTVDTLAHLTHTDPLDLPGSLTGWALTGDDLAALDIPVSYTASLRDEIIPPEDWHLLRDRVRDIDIVELDDVHGSPGHVTETQLWTIRSLLRARRARGPESAVIAMLLAMARSRR
jgi:pimeloyl-ACP methyl ester carboxylesterase